MDRTLWARLQYEGTRFAGWQLQPGARTVQGVIETVLERLCSGPVRVHAAGRTDAGVHALGMAVSATVPARWTPSALRQALNALLPPDCWVTDVQEVRPGFHARKSATGRAYCYRLGTDPAARSPFRHPFEWALCRELDAQALHQGAAALPGRHDFRTLAVGTRGKKNCCCAVHRAEWLPRADGEGWEFHVAADRFLHHLVRILVGTMVEAALGRRPAGDLARLLAMDPDVRAAPPAPPNGLYFVEATYPDQWFRLGDAVT